MTVSSFAEIMDLSGKNVLVTGSTSGIGKGIAISLAQSGCNVMLNGFGDANEIESFRAGLAAETGVKVAYNGADLTDVEAIENLFRSFSDIFGDVHGVVNNAGVQHVAPVEDFPVSNWDLIIALNLTASFHTSRLCFKQMKERGWGRIINIASAHGLTASPYKSAYVTAKHGILGLTKTLALEGAEHGVRVNAICPGYVRTPLVENQIADTAKARNMDEEDVIKDVMLERQPTKEFTSVEEIGRMVCFLMSDAATSINGSDIKMEGGWVAQ